MRLAQAKPLRFLLLPALRVARCYYWKGRWALCGDHDEGRRRIAELAESYMQRMPSHIHDHLHGHCRCHLALTYHTSLTETIMDLRLHFPVSGSRSEVVPASVRPVPLSAEGTTMPCSPRADVSFITRRRLSDSDMLPQHRVFRAYDGKPVCAEQPPVGRHPHQRQSLWRRQGQVGTRTSSRICPDAIQRVYSP